MQPIDLLLRQGEPAELEAFRDEIAADPLLALEVADTVALLERLRGLRVEPDPEFAGKLAGVVRRAARQLPPEPNRAAPWLAAAAIAAVTFFTAAWFDPLRLHARPAAVVAATSSTAATAVAPSAALAVLDVPTTADIAHQDALGTMRRRFELERATELSAALENAIAAEQAGSAAALRRWLDPKNALAVLHLDHELRSRVDVRRAALVSEGAMLAA
ncbi:MAG: hypothetical protein KDE27_29015, partial [Planctomycetes bacterium]|nr:hypothetical protein [Planctomycetota bacterium]